MKKIIAVLDTSKVDYIFTRANGDVEALYQKEQMECKIIDKVLVGGNTMYLVYTNDEKALKKIQLISPSGIIDIKKTYKNNNINCK